MSHPLLEKLSGVRRRARRLLVLYGACWVLAAVLLTIVLAGLCDFLFRFEDPGIRLMVSAAVAGVLAWSVSRYLWPALGTRLTDLDVALRIERRYPALAERLSSTVQFLHEAEDDPAAGSALLRRSVITQTTSQIEAYDLADAVQSRPTRRVALAALGVLLVAGMIASLSPELSRIALARLANPLGSVAWPQQNHLQWKEEVRRVALGQPLELAVVDARGARLPAEVRLRLRFAAGGDETTEDVVHMQFVDGAFVYRQESVTRPLEYKAEGGDDTSMPWTALEVVEPPSVESLSVVLHPPGYTGWPSEMADKHFRALKGTSVEIHATSTKPLKAAALVLESGQQIAAAVADDGFGVVVPADDQEPFIVEESGSYSLLLTDREGFQGGAQVRYEIRVQPDLPPAVTFEEPKNTLFVTPEAVVPLTIAAKDDLAIRNVALEFLRSDASEQGESRTELFTGPEQHAPSTERPADSMGESRVVEYAWNLAELGLKPGVQVTFHGAASDYLPQTGRSSPMRLTIITPQELNDRIAQRQTYLLGELARVLKMQQQSRSQVASVEIQWGDVGRLNKPDVDHLQAAELAQRQVARTLTDPGEGVPGLIQGLLDDLKNNKVDSPEVERRMQGLLSEIERIDREHLTTIDRELNSAIKGAQSSLPEEKAPADKPPSTDPAVGKSLTAAGGQQDEVIASLEQMLGELSQWDNYRRFHREITQLKTDQEEVARQTSDIGRETITKDPGDLTSQQQADLKKLAQRQQELGRRFDKLQQQMGEMESELEKNDPLAAGVIEDALHQARQQGISGKMREAGQSVEQNQVGQAGQRQQQIGENLQEMLDTLANRSEHELSRLVQKLREAENELQSLREKQQGLRKKMAEAAKNPDEAERRQELQRLSRQQQELEQEAQRMARKLQRLQAEQASRATSRAGGQMAQAGQQGQQGNAGEANEAAEAAQQDLDEAQQALAERRRQAEVDLATEQLAKIEDGIKSMHQRQQEVVLETERLESLKQQNGKWTRGQALSVRDLARLQTALHDETGELSKKLEAAEVFALALKGAAREMLRAVEQLEARDTGELAQAAEKNALRRFEQLLESLQPDKPEAGGQKQQGEGQGGQQGGQQPPGDGIPSLAQLKMLKLMQLEINDRTQGLEEQFAKAKELSAEQQQEYQALAEEQSKLADLVLNLSKPKEDAPGDDPAELPELKLDQPKPKSKPKTLEELLLPSDEESSSR
jgi:hypothetical protein